MLLTLIGIGFGPLPRSPPSRCRTPLPIHQFGTAIGTMTFIRNLFATMLVAVFGAIVLGGIPPR